MSEYDPISTGSETVDQIIGGDLTDHGRTTCLGFPRGKLSDIYGPPGTGKTTLALQACREAQKDGGSAAFVDADMSFPLDWAETIGVDTSDDKWLHVQPRSKEKGFELTQKFCEEGIDVVVVDPVWSAKPNQDSLKTRYLKQLINEISSTRTALIFVNRISERRDSHDQPEKWYSSLRLQLEVEDEEYNGSKPEKKIIRVTNRKTAVSANRRHEDTFAIRSGVGIEETETQ